MDTEPGGRQEPWELSVARDDPSRTRLRSVPNLDIEPGQALLRVDRVGLTANNVTYAVLGEALRYWEFFPTDPGWGIVPLWGFADVVASTTDGVEEGARVYGYLPSASHLLVRPGRVNAGGFRDASEHRSTLPSPYNAYALTTGDPAYEAEREDLLVLYRPLFYTSYLLADRLLDDDLAEADAVVLSSASSKTAYGTAFELAERGGRVVGLTSAGNIAFVESLGCYDQVLVYDAIEELSPSRPVVYADVAGDPALLMDLRTHLGDVLVRALTVGISHHEAAAEGTSDHRADEFFFAPDRIKKRAADWGRDELDRRFGEAWRRFASTVDDWVDVTVHEGPEALEEIWLDTYEGRVDPREGHVVTGLSPSRSPLT